MILKYVPSVSEADFRRYPVGYWVAKTDDGSYVDAGPDPLTAVSALLLIIEKELAEWEGTAR